MTRFAQVQARRDPAETGVCKAGQSLFEVVDDARRFALGSSMSLGNTRGVERVDTVNEQRVDQNRTVFLAAQVQAAQPQPRLGRRVSCRVTAEAAPSDEIVHTGVLFAARPDAAFQRAPVDTVDFEDERVGHARVHTQRVEPHAVACARRRCKTHVGGRVDDLRRADGAARRAVPAGNPHACDLYAGNLHAFAPDRAQAGRAGSHRHARVGQHAHEHRFGAHHVERVAPSDCAPPALEQALLIRKRLRAQVERVHRAEHKQTAHGLVLGNQERVGPALGRGDRRHDALGLAADHDHVVVQVVSEGVVGVVTGVGVEVGVEVVNRVSSGVFRRDQRRLRPGRTDAAQDQRTDDAQPEVRKTVP